MNNSKKRTGVIAPPIKRTRNVITNPLVTSSKPIPTAQSQILPGTKQNTAPLIHQTMTEDQPTKKVDEPAINKPTDDQILNNFEQKLNAKVTTPGKQKKARKPRDKKNFKEWISTRKKKRLESTELSKFAVFNRYVTNTLNQKKPLRNEWIIIGSLSALIMIFFGVIIGIMQRFIGLNALNYPAVANANTLNNVMRIVGIFCLVLLVVPYLYLSAAFFSGINQIHKSKSVHYLIWFTFIINFLFMLVVSILLIVGYQGLDSFNLARSFY
ncbi:MPN157 family protein [Mycoplasma amphoriforme]|uniref:Uncharacterized protein n=1 Tax=Mycoplasma amphoriforme A39 TaxID=572419 RepID=A0A292IJ29_9MOLU|nr:unnamed protein product [Mycoplasma amphoriforme A39]